MSILGRLVGLLLLTAIALFPLWIFLFARSMLNPEGFWQNLVLTGIGVWVLGGLQVLLLGLLALALIAIWFEGALDPEA